MPVLLLGSFGRLPFWELDPPAPNKHNTIKRPATALVASENGYVWEAEEKGTDGGQVRAPFRVKSRSRSWKATPQPPHDISNDSCDEEKVYRNRCQKQHNRYARSLAKAYGKRGAYFHFPGTSEWGLGHSLSMVYLLHDVCMRANRACHIKLCAHSSSNIRPPSTAARLNSLAARADDMELHKFFGYRGGASWCPPRAECGYQLDKAQNMSLLPETFSWDSDSDIDQLVEHLRNSLAPLVNITSLASMSFQAERFLPAFPWDGPSDGGNPRLTRCFNAFVTEPRFHPVPPPSPKQRVTYHLRTSFADVDDEMLPARGHRNETAAWARAACGGRDRLPKGTHVMSDSPGLTEQLGRKPAQPARLQGSRNWNSSHETKKMVATDAVIAGRSLHLYTQTASSFLRPVVARSMCAQRVFQMGHESSACRHFEDVFPRDLFTHLKQPPPGVSQVGGEDALLARLPCTVQPEVAERADHPCHDRSCEECRDMFALAMQGTGAGRTGASR